MHWVHNALAHVPKSQHTVLAAAIRQAFTQPDPKSASEVWRHVADQLRSRWPKLARLMDDSEADVLACMAFPAQHRTKLHSTNPLERLNKELKRRADVVGIFPSEEAIIRLLGAVLFKQNDEWQSQHRTMQVEAFAQIDTAPLDPLQSLTTQAARPVSPIGLPKTSTTLTDVTICDACCHQAERSRAAQSRNVLGGGAGRHGSGP